MNVPAAKCCALQDETLLNAKEVDAKFIRVRQMNLQLKPIIGGL